MSTSATRGQGRAARLLFDLLVPGTAYYLAAKGSFFLAIAPSTAASVWPAAGIAIAAVFLRGYVPLVGLGVAAFAFYAESWLDPDDLARTGLLALALVVGPLAQAAFAGHLARRYVRPDNALLDDGSILRCVLIAGPLGCVVAATVNVTVLYAYGVVSASEWWWNWLTWWVGDSIGAMVVTPLLVVMAGRPPVQPLGRKLTLCVPLLGAMALLFVVFNAVRDEQLASMHRQLDIRIRALYVDLERTMASDIELIYSLKDIIEADPQLTEDIFRSFTSASLRRHGHVQALEWIPLIAHAERAEFERRIPITQRAPDGNMVPAAAREHYLPVEFVEPVASNERALGYDVATSQLARPAQLRAMRSGTPSATPPLTLVQEAEAQYGVVIYLRARRPRPDGTWRDGLVAGVFRTGEYALATLATDRRPNVAVRITDAAVPGAVLYQSDGIGTALAHFRHHEINTVAELRVAGRHWRVEFFPAPDLLAAHYSETVSWLVLTGGLLFTAMLGGWLLSLTGRTMQIAHVVEERTEYLEREVSARRQAQAELSKLSRALEHSPSMVVITDPHGHIEYVNPKFCAVTGYAATEVMGESAALLHADETGPKSYAQVRQLLQTAGQWSGELRSRRKGGQLYWAELLIAPIHDEDDRLTHYVLVHQDITESKSASDRMKFQATHDELTGLINRREFARRVEGALELAHVESARHALCVLDLDQFKVVNDTAGHAAGDELLRQVGALLREQTRRADSIARLGGDEFGILMLHCDLDQAERTAETVRSAIEQYRFDWQGSTFSIGVSIGVVGLDTAEVATTVTELFKRADSACYAAKDAGRNRIVVYTEDDAALAQRSGQMQIVSQLGEALDEGRFVLCVQPIVPLQDASAKPAAELLVRMRDREHRTVQPGAFLPAAERYNLASRIDQWVVANAFEWLGRNPGLLARLGYCAVNLSGQSLGDPTVLKAITDARERWQLPPQSVMFEITETAAIANLVEARQFIAALKSLGFRFALDDFGSGLSSFAYLKNMSIDALKIDGMFVRDVLHDPVDASIVRSINEVGHLYGLTTVAEFVENDAIRERMRDIGIDYAQGYGIARPMPIEAFLQHSLLAAA